MACLTELPGRVVGFSSRSFPPKLDTLDTNNQLPEKRVFPAKKCMVNSCPLRIRGFQNCSKTGDPKEPNAKKQESKASFLGGSMVQIAQTQVPWEKNKESHGVW